MHAHVMDAPDVRGEVDLVDINSPSLRTLRANVITEQAGIYEIEVEGPAAQCPAVGGLVVLNWVRHEHPRVSAVVLERQGSWLRVRERRRKPRDRRVFPRLVGGIPLRYRIVPAAEAELASARWMAGGTDDAPAEAWRSPDPFMNFSATGLRFDDAPLCDQGDLLLCELGVGGEPERWRAVAEVIRTYPIEGDEEVAGASHHIAVMFLDAPMALAEALEAYTLKLQRLTFT